MAYQCSAGLYVLNYVGIWFIGAWPGHVYQPDTWFIDARPDHVYRIKLVYGL
jgi:hypothetical protein